VDDREPASSRAEQRRRTEERILAAAARLFVERGYERTTIRGVAQAAGVDAGLVMHYFGSKQELFRQIVQVSPAQVPSGPPRQVADQLLAQLAESLTDEPVASLALLRSMLTYPDAAQAAQQGSARYQAMLAQSIPGPDADVRAALLIALVVGVVVSRHLLQTGALRDAVPEHITGLLGPCVRALVMAEPS
jgi:AcrR family transcriptional regulator